MNRDCTVSHSSGGSELARIVEVESGDYLSRFVRGLCGESEKKIDSSTPQHRATASVL